MNLKAVQTNVTVSNFMLNNKSNNKSTLLVTHLNEICGKDLINRLPSEIVKTELLSLLYFILSYFFNLFYFLLDTAWPCQKTLTEFSLRSVISICSHAPGILSFLAYFH